MSGEKTKSATEISEMLLNVSQQALLEQDFETFATCIHLPHFICSAEDEETMETREDLHDVFNKVVQDHVNKRITELVRVCVVAEYQSNSRIKATYLTHLISGNDRVGDAFPCLVKIEHIEGCWKISSTQFDIDSKTTVGYALRIRRLQQSKQQ